MLRIQIARNFWLKMFLKFLFYVEMSFEGQLFKIKKSPIVRNILKSTRRYDTSAFECTVLYINCYEHKGLQATEIY